MLSIAQISASSNAQVSEYFLGLTGAVDYYSGHLEKQGQWLGNGAAALGLNGVVEYEQLPAALAGSNPLTGELLAAPVSDRKAATDCTFSSPKSVSAAWAVADPDLRQKIEEAHQAAVTSGVRYLEREAFCTRHGAGGHEHRSVVDGGGLIVAAFQHSSSRDSDPQLHTHAVVMNMIKDGRSIDFDSTHKLTAGALYRAELAYLLQKIGFTIMAEDMKEGDLAGFKIAGLPDELVEKWSSRSNQIEEYLLKNGLAHTPENAQKAALDTRKTKDEQPLESLFIRWKAEAKEFNFDLAKVAQLAADNEISQAVTMASPSNPRLDEQKILEKITEKTATFTKQKALTAFAIDLPGRLSAAEVEARTAAALESKEVVKLAELTKQQASELGEHFRNGPLYSTPEMIQTEKNMLRNGKYLATDSSKFHINQKTIDEAAHEQTLSSEQKIALTHICRPTRLAIVEGYAGSGKTHMLAAAKDVYKKSGYIVMGTAISAKASVGLADSAGIESRNLALFNIDLKRCLINLSEKSVLFVDESAMVGTRQLSDLIELVNNAGAKLVLVGHSEQLQAIDAGAPMRALSDVIGSAKLTEIHRQKSEIHREIANDFRIGNAAQALKKLSEIDGLNVTDTQMEALKAAATASIADSRCSASTLLIAASREEVRQLNLLVRAELKKDGMIDKENEVMVKTTLGMRLFSAGDQVIFGKKMNFGDKGEKSKTVINGTMGKVVKTKGAQLSVKLENGKIVDVNTQEYQKIDHGYATTVHKSQGSTVDRVHVVVADRAGKEWSYVAASRHRESLTIHTARENLKDVKNKDQKIDIEKSILTKNMSTSNAKDMATDYQ